MLDLGPEMKTTLSKEMAASIEFIEVTDVTKTIGNPRYNIVMGNKNKTFVSDTSFFQKSEADELRLKLQGMIEEFLKTKPVGDWKERPEYKGFVEKVNHVLRFYPGQIEVEALERPREDKRMPAFRLTPSQFGMLRDVVRSLNIVGITAVNEHWYEDSDGPQKKSFLMVYPHD